MLYSDAQQSSRGLGISIAVIIVDQYMDTIHTVVI